jgi:hypothetical protein
VVTSNISTRIIPSGHLTALDTQINFYSIPVRNKGPQDGMAWIAIEEDTAPTFQNKRHPTNRLSLKTSHSLLFSVTLRGILKMSILVTSTWMRILEI